MPLQRLRVLFALMVRDMSAKFGRSVGGYLWAIAEPLGGIVLLAVAFSLALRLPPIGTSFLFFYATGVIPFSLYSKVAGGAANAVRANRGLLTYSVVTPLDAVLASALLEVLTMSVVALVLFAGIILVDDVAVNFEPIRVVRAFAMAAVLGLGVGTLNCVLFGFFPTWKNIWGVLTRPLFLVSGVFFTFNSAPPAFQEVLWYNPITHDHRRDARGLLRRLPGGLRLLSLRLRHRAHALRDRGLPPAPPRELPDRAVKPLRHRFSP